MDGQEKNCVLIIDDDKTNIITLTHILSPEYNIHAAKSGREGIKLAEKYLPDLILLDIRMPGMDGYETFQALNDSERTRGLPVIFITGLDKEADEEKGLALGAADYITKPFSSELVKLRVRNRVGVLRTPPLKSDYTEQDPESEPDEPEKTHSLNFIRTTDLFKKLEPMLVSHNYEALNLLGPLRSINGAEELVQKIEDFEFSEAFYILQDLKEKIS